MLISAAFPSKYLKSSDIGNKTWKLKIASVKIENVGSDAEEHKPVLYFEGAQKGMVLNKTNAEAIAYVHGDETDNWLGKEIEVFTMMVQYQGRSQPGIRVRATPGQWVPDGAPLNTGASNVPNPDGAATMSQPVTPPVVGSQAPGPSDLDDDIPF